MFGLRGFLGESLCGVTSFLFLRDSLKSAYSVGMLCLKADRGVLSGVSVGVAFCRSRLFSEEQVLIKEMCQQMMHFLLRHSLKPTCTAEQWAYLLEPCFIVSRWYSVICFCDQLKKYGDKTVIRCCYMFYEWFL